MGAEMIVLIALVMVLVVWVVELIFDDESWLRKIANEVSDGVYDIWYFCLPVVLLLIYELLPSGLIEFQSGTQL